MPSRVLLISSNRCTTPDPVFPLGLAYLNAALRNAGHTTKWFDLQVGPEPLQHILDTFQPQIVGLSLRNIDDVLIRKRETYYTELASLCAEIRRHARAIIVLGGSGYSIFPEKLLQLSQADFGICGPGETPFTQLIAAIETGSDPTHIPGLVYPRAPHAPDAPHSPLPTTYSPRVATVLSDADRPPQITAHYLSHGGML